MVTNDTNFLIRFIKHSLTSEYFSRRQLSKQDLNKITETISEIESLHGGEIRVCIERRLNPLEIWRFKSARARAESLFSELRIWDTEQNNGILLYILLSEKSIEIVADRAYNDKISNSKWQEICSAIALDIKNNSLKEGICNGIKNIGALIAQFFPNNRDNVNEQENKPHLL